jgi:predicted alpha-1,2-mannosidase
MNFKHIIKLFIFISLITQSCVVLKNNIGYVNPLIGTGGHGHTFPGATLPYGMVQLSPDTRTTGWDACGGYHYSDSTIIGFSHTHLSGTGIGDYGDILIMPFSVDEKEFNERIDYHSKFSHDKEKAAPGYYSVMLDDFNILAELTTSLRAGFHRYTYNNKGISGLVIDLSHSIHNGRNSQSNIHVISNTEIEGMKRSKGWATDQYVYFYMKFNKPFSYTLFDNNVEITGTNGTESRNSKAIITFNTNPGEKILIKVGISSVDNAGARNNLESEITGWDFDKVHSLAYEQWGKQLEKIQVSGGTDNEKTIFYTALYHTSISPNIFSDADGRYRGIDKKIYLNKTFTDYTVFSLWDTYRAFHPLITLIDPARDRDFVKALLSKYDEGGILPKWELAANYTGTMIGYHAVPVITDAYMKGIRDFDVEKAYKAMVASSVYDTTGFLYPSNEVRDKLMPIGKYYNSTMGYIPSNLTSKSVSLGLEFAYDDWCIAQMAKALNDTANYRIYTNRSMHYKNYYDPASGFMRGKNSDGSWRIPFNPKFSNHQGADYVEGNAWQWTWYVPHDINGFVELAGGKKKFLNKLDSLFSADSSIDGEESSPDISGMIGQYAHGNEPSHHVIHIYNYLGQPWKTEQLADSILNSLYFNNPDGLSGNEDCGQMSAWYILNAMGIYSFCPGDTMYSIGRPIFDEVIIQLPDRKKFVIKTEDNSRDHKYIQSVMLNGKPLLGPFISHQEIMAGGNLVVKMGRKPNYQWGTD